MGSAELELWTVVGHTETIQPNRRQVCPFFG